MMVHGWLILDKPEGITSTHAGNLVKRIFNVKSLGHAGTLDPFACGVLPLALGEATKTMPYVVAKDKEYIFDLTWGCQTDTDDREGQVIARSDYRPQECEILAAIPQFIGEIEQQPPIYSALKIQGKPAYQRARAGEDVNVPSRVVHIYDLTVLDIFPDKVQLKVCCGAGTYIRSLGRDLAIKLGTLGHLTYLKRVRVGKFHIDDAISLDILRENRHTLDILSLVRSIRTVLDDIPAVSVSVEVEKKLRQGQAVCLTLPAQGLYLVEAADRPVALAEYNGIQLHVKRVFNC
jgi:tRNA pseudouridine55 synthase